MTTDSAAEPSAVTPDKPMAVDSQAEFDELVASHDVVLADFYADWCGPCRMIEPVVETLAADTPALVAKVDVDANQQLARTYGVRGVPTLVLFADGTQVEKVVGVESEAKLRSLIETHAGSAIHE